MGGMHLCHSPLHTHPTNAHPEHCVYTRHNTILYGEEEMTTPIVTREEFLQWIMEQPDEKSLSWDGTHTLSDCKCPMAEYTHQMYPNVPASAAYYGVFLTANRGEHLWKFEQDFDFASFHDESCTNYGQLKASLKQKGLV